jgi:hypothetical protein
MEEKLSDEKVRHAVGSPDKLLTREEYEAIGDVLSGRRVPVPGLSDGAIARRLHLEVARLHDELADTTAMFIVFDRMADSEKRISDYLLEKSGLSRQEVELETGWTPLERLASELGVDLDEIRKGSATKKDSGD